MNTVAVPIRHRFVYNPQGLPVWWQWCEQTLGPSNDSGYGRPATKHYWHLLPGPGYKMWFADPVHATLFRLRWA
jgi:hypothetical protein